MLARRVHTTYEAVRHWCLKFRQGYANPLRRTPPSQAGRQVPFMVYAILYDARLLRPGMELAVLLQHRRDNAAASSHLAATFVV
jgi:hypothetical protein